MKKLTTISLIGLLAVFAFASCNTENSNKTKPKKEKKITLQEVENPNNPYDKVGRVHNEFLTYLEPKLNSLEASGQTEASRGQILKWVAGFYQKKNMDFGKKQIAAYNNMFDIMDGFTQLAPRPMPSSPFCNQWPWICKVLNPQPRWPMPLPLLKQKGQSNTKNTLDFIQKVKELEKKATDMPDSTQKLKMRKRGILTRYAVARYSAAYWHNKIDINGKKNPNYLSRPQEISTDAVFAFIGNIIYPGYGGIIGAVASAVNRFVNWVRSKWHDWFGLVIKDSIGSDKIIGLQIKNNIRNVNFPGT